MDHHTHNLEDLHGRSRHAAAPAQPNRATRRHPPKNGQRGYVGITEAATYLGVTPKTVRKLTATRELAPYRLGTKMLRIKLADFDAAYKRVPGGAVVNDRQGKPPDGSGRPGVATGTAEQCSTKPPQKAYRSSSPASIPILTT